MSYEKNSSTGAAPSAPVGAVPSIDTPALDSLLATFSICDSDPMAPKAAYENARAALIAHIDQHVASQVLAARDAALEEAAVACEAWGRAKVAKWSGDAEMSEDAKARAWDALQCAIAIRALKGRPAISHSGEGAAQAGQVTVPEAPALDDQLADATNALRQIAGNGGEAGKTARAALHVIAAIHRRAAAPSPASESLRSPQEAAGTEKGAAS